MTIKLSTTNSVNKTLQHKKALWDLETLCGDSRGYSGGRASPTPQRRFLFFLFLSLSFSLGASGSTGFWVTVMRSGTRGVENASNPSSSVNKLSIWRSAEARCHAGTRAGEGGGINKHRRSVQWSSSLVDEGENLNMELRRVGEGRVVVVVGGRGGLRFCFVSGWLSLNIMCHDLLSTGLPNGQKEPFGTNVLPRFKPLKLKSPPR